MLSENQRIRGLISSVIDIVLLIAADLLANFLRFNWLPPLCTPHFNHFSIS